MVKNLRINKEIIAKELRVVDVDGTQLGILTLPEALTHAENAGFDLVEVAPNAAPPVCRIMDYGKFRYQQSKKEHIAKKSQSTIQIKEVRLRPKTEEHDLMIKIRRVLKFIEQNNKVKINMMFRGREIVYADRGMKLMEDIKSKLGDSCVIEAEPKREGRNMIMIVAPLKKK